MFALHTGASGLGTYGEAMTVVGANIANVNTLGFKSSRVNFEDMLATNLSGVKGRIGKGVQLGAVQADFTQGSLTPSTMVTDMALDGIGFFTLKDQGGRTFYTRAGNFQYDKDGFLVSQDGAAVQVRDLDPQSGDTIGFPHQAKLVGLNSPPKATGDGANRSGIKLVANLNSEADAPKVPFDPTNVQHDMYNFSSTVTVYDENGGAHVVNVVFRKLPDRAPQIDPATGQEVPGSGLKNKWAWYGVSDAAEFGGTPGVLVATSGGFLNFTENGRLLNATAGRFVQTAPGQVGANGEIIPPGPPQLVEAPLSGATPVPQITLPFANSPLVVGVDFGQGSNPDDPGDQRNGLEGLTQFATESKVFHIGADGYKAGSLEDIEVSRDGVIIGHFDNGTNRNLYKIALTRFASPENLLRKGEGLFEESLQSGRPVAGNANDGVFGAVRSQNLERSNVDLAKEFVRMIETQRAFQANAKSVTTSDEMLSDLVAMKR
jgi:flagellar hook protein FlgE